MREKGTGMGKEALGKRDEEKRMKKGLRIEGNVQEKRLREHDG